MRTLYEFIVESGLILEADGGFRLTADSIDVLLANKKLRANANDAREVVKDLLERAYKESGNEIGQNQLVYSDSAKYFKVPYFLCDIIIDLSETKEFEKLISVYRTNKYSNKIVVSLKSGGKKNSKLFETGNGSVGRISTAEQENATCQTWNNFIKQMKQVDGEKFNNAKYVETNLNNAVIDIEIPKDWANSCIMQCRGVLNYLTESKCNPENFVMVRYGDSGDIEETAETKSSKKIANAYKDFVDKYTAELKAQSEYDYISQKDNFDPTDVMIYDATKVDSIISKLSECVAALGKKESPDGSSGDPTKTARDLFMENLFMRNLLIGISLKKITGNKHTYEKYNIGSNVAAKSVTNIASVHIADSSKSIAVICKGDFNFDKMTLANVKDANTKEDKGFVEIQSSNANTCKLVMRTFGNGNVGMDCFLCERDSDDNFNPKEPSLGKCPVALWRKELNIESTDIETCVSEFNKMFTLEPKSDKSKTKKFVNEEIIKSKLEKIINGAIKSGPHCFPFILIH